jgi:hypothetical protein
MTREEQILRGIRQLGSGNDKTFIAVVDNNHPDKDVIDVRDLSGTLYQEVRKRSAIGNPETGILITPKNNSSVIVSRIGDSDEMFVEMFSEVESIMFDDGQNGGLTITPELKKQLDKMSQRIDVIYNALQNSPTTAQDGGAAYKSSITGILSAMTDREDFSQIENNKIKH